MRRAEEQKPAQIDFADRASVTEHVLNLLNELQAHYSDGEIGGLLAIALMTHVADVGDRDLFDTTPRYLDQSLTALWYQINPDGKTLVSPLASRHLH
jgi:hypothetical protein